MEEQVARTAGRPAVRVRTPDDLGALAAELQRLGVVRTPPVEEVAARAETWRARRRLWQRTGRRREEFGPRLPN